MRVYQGRMFEAAILPAIVESGATLRPLDWGELAARFSAVRDMRALVSRPCGPGSSFGAHAATGLPYADRPNGYGERPVNHPALGPMKPLETITSATTTNVGEGDQGTQ